MARREDGYHLLETVFYPVPIHDEISIEERPDDGQSRCLLSINGNPIEGDPEKNLVVRAYRQLEKQYELPPVSITLTKNIPMQAGMGGGSADGAFTLRLLNEMFHLGMTTEELEAAAVPLGADCAFFIKAQPAYAEGIGEILSPIELSLNNYTLAIVKPPVAVSTREAFAYIKCRKPAKCCRDIVQQPIETWRDELVNDFEESIFPQYPAIAAIKQKLYDLGAVYASMSGSGSAVFALFANEPEPLQSHFPDCFTAVL